MALLGDVLQSLSLMCAGPLCALPRPGWSCCVLPCPALPCPALPCPALPCPALPCPALPHLQQDHISTGPYAPAKHHHAQHTLLILHHDTDATCAALTFISLFRLKSVVHHKGILYITICLISHVRAGSSNTTSVDPPMDPQLVNVDWGVCECNQTMQVHVLLPRCGICCISHTSIWK